MEPESTYFQPEEPTFWSKFKGNAVELIQFIAILAAVFVVIRFFIAEPHRVSGNSMVPNFHDGDYLITNKLIFPKIPLNLGKPERGEVIILQNPRNPDQVFIKRIIGMPGEKIMILRGQVFINDQPISEPYLPPGTRTPDGAYLIEGEEIIIPDRQFFVMGDNRGGSSDSREWGPLKNDLVIGQAFLRYWPISKLGLLKISQPSI